MKIPLIPILSCAYLFKEIRVEVKYGYACCNKRSQDFWRKFPG